MKYPTRSNLTTSEVIPVYPKNHHFAKVGGQHGGMAKKADLRFMQPLETDTEGEVRKRRCFSAVGGGAVLLDKKNPRGGGVGGLF